MSASILRVSKAITSVVLVGSGALLLSGWKAPEATPTASQFQECPSSGEISLDASGALTHVAYLADDALEGREVGSAGARCASEYIAAHFAEMGLQPVGEDGTYFQLFPVRVGAELLSGNALAFESGALTLEDEWMPYGFSGAAEANAQLVYGGDAINRPTATENPWPQLDVEGKVVVVEFGDSEVRGRVPMNASSHFKATVTQGRGAAGVIVLLPDGMDLPSLSSETRQFLRIPVVAVRGGVADAVRSAARAGETVELKVALQERMVDARNVVALLPGSDPAAQREIVVIGAHYDHLGWGGEGSLAGGVRAIHNGADDNASGTAALMEVAEDLVGMQPKRTIMFIAFTGEEKGLWGAQHYVSDPIFPLTGHVAMLNMDMVGRLDGGTMTVFGTGTADEWTEVLERAEAQVADPVPYATSPDGEGPSDHAAFFRAGMPVLHFFTNTHEDYHRPSDDTETIDGEGLERVVEFVSAVAMDVAGTPDTEIAQITFAETAAANPHAGAQAGPISSSSSSSGYGPYLGTIPDMTPIDFGVRLGGVREGSPAEQGGLQAGDVIVEFGGQETGDLYAYTYALRAHEPGDEVEVVVLRDEERVTLKVTLGRR